MSMKKFVNEELNEDNKKPVNLKEEMVFYTDMKDSIEDDEDYLNDFTTALEEFGVDEADVGVISSYGADSAWEDIIDELDKEGIRYYEFDLYDGESAIIVDVHEVNSILQESLKTNENKTKDIQTRRSNLDDKLSKIINTIEKEKKVDESIKSEFPFTQLLSESDRKNFASLDATDKVKVANEISKVPTTDSKVILKLWENALATNKVDEPLWLKLAPKAYREAYDKSDDILKENINAKSEFFTLNTQYQINNFWENSGIISKPTLTLNEAIIAKTSEEGEQKLDSFVANIGEYMRTRY